jgi:2'-5' RNA ligase
MRLFIAIDFPDEVKDTLYSLSEKLRAQSRQGNFSRRENQHLTLSFLGETGKVDKIQRAMDRAAGGAFSLETGRLGRFRRDGGDVWWIGLKENPPLTALQKRLSSLLEQEGFPQEHREYRPHLTLGRQVLFPPGIDKSIMEWYVPSMQIPVNQLSLMKSERIGPKLVYTPSMRRCCGGPPQREGISGAEQQAGTGG